MLDVTVSIGRAAALLGVAVVTLRRWCKENKISVKYRTAGGHRRCHDLFHFCLRYAVVSMNILNGTVSKRVKRNEFREYVNLCSAHFVKWHAVIRNVQIT